MRRTFITDAAEFNMHGEILITVYDDTVTLAIREDGQRSWGPPILTRESP